MFLWRVEHETAIRRKRELHQRAGEARARLDDGEDRARRHIEARERAAQIADRLAHEPVGAACLEEAVELEHLLRVAARLEHPQADVEMVGAQIEDRAVKLAR